MRTLSLRGWLLAISVLFALLVVGGISLTTYVILSDGMQVVAYDTTERVASSAAGVMRSAVTDSEMLAASQGLFGAERTEAATQLLIDQLPETLAKATFGETEFALYGPDARLEWASSSQALHPDQHAARRRALTALKPMFSTIDAGHVLSGLFTEAELGVTVVHTPVTLPGDAIGVLDVTYLPSNEQEVIDAVRIPMLILAISATLIMVVLMQTSMAWVLNLVSDLRKAADSIDAGRLEERLPADADNEIGDLARSLNRLLDRLQRRAEAQTRFVADASHELATPVAGIRGYTSILRNWGGSDETVREEAIDAIDRESRRMARLSSDLLNLLHLDQGLVLKSEKFDLNKLVRERLATTATRYLDKDIEFEGPVDESLVITGDPDRIEDVLSILLDNAGKYTPVGGQVVVSTRGERDRIFFRVSDTGEGIAPQDVPRVFDRFFRSDKARAEGETGFGLGLSICKSIVDSMGGTIEVASEQGSGTTFEVSLPKSRT
ncbi:MAG TPA: HAMP domain-containing sensor histidine kinase [Coriobacteriia bacterium]|nr:HAMP domain-containing sensor histidine kinase [Coriobacteriia bacterium]